ncbi:MAG: class I SAM-dependent methyltransferase [Deltaproteobacteria bacterium]|nr:class I SAM-dependent methyltransferase [Deltaproteobacteria bacterium]
MKIFRFFRLDSIAWSLRRLHCPIDKNALVLEVGSGGNPYFRSNVLCDAYLDTRERHFAPLICDRPICLAYVEKLPFKDDAFDFVIASHVLEHSEAPEQFLSELQRVAKAGYIEVPDAFMERLTCYLDHRLEITDKDGSLLIRKKQNYCQDKAIRDLFTNKASAIFPKWVSRFPFHFHVRYYWEKKNGGIQYKIQNSEYQFDWLPPPSSIEENDPKISLKALLKDSALKLIRRLFSQNKRNKNIDMIKLCRCLECGNDNLMMTSEKIICSACGKNFSINKGIIDFTK